MRLEMVGKNIDMIRKERGLTIKVLSKKIGASPQTISRHINGHAIADICTIAKYAEALGCTVGDLTEGTADRTKFTVETDITHIYPYNLACAAMKCGSDVYERLETAWDVYIPGFMEAVGMCSEREQRVLALRYKNLMTLEEAGKEMGVTGERIRQIEVKALRFLRSLLGKKLWSISGMKEDAEKRFSEEKEELLKMLSERGEEIEMLRRRDPSAPVMKKNADIDLCETDASVRLYNCLKRVGVEKLSDVSLLTKEEVKRIKNLGTGTLDELQDLMDKYGLHFLVIDEAGIPDINCLTDDRKSARKPRADEVVRG